jgi:hypothetical protein
MQDIGDAGDAMRDAGYPKSTFQKTDSTITYK